jgi:GTPase
MLIDEVKIKVLAGNGGKGSFKYLGTRKGKSVGPSGGDGGRGGSIYFKASNNINDLSEFQFKKILQAPNGEDGNSKNHNGKDAKDLIFDVALGTKILDEKYKKEYELTKNSQSLLIAKGGEGEKGSVSLEKGAKQTVKRIGQNTQLFLSISLIADVGLIGLPNSGKSSLLKALTNAEPKIGDYPFTTLEPNLGVMDKIIIADIPGLIEGASQGKGLGIKFLKHIEKTKIILHTISAEDQNPLKSYQTVRNEFERYNKELLTKKEIILLTKKDLVNEKEISLKMRLFKNKNAFPISIYDFQSLERIKNYLT